MTKAEKRKAIINEFYWFVEDISKLEGTPDFEERVENLIQKYYPDNVDTSEIEARIAGVVEYKSWDDEQDLITPVKYTVAEFIEKHREQFRTIHTNNILFSGASGSDFESWLNSEECYKLAEHLMKAPMNVIDSVMETVTVEELANEGITSDFNSFNNTICSLMDDFDYLMAYAGKELAENSSGVDYQSKMLSDLLKRFACQVKAYNTEQAMMERMILG